MPILFAAQKNGEIFYRKSELGRPTRKGIVYAKLGDNQKEAYWLTDYWR
jgi:hypothetical protein